MSTSVTSIAAADFRKCSFCAEEILSDSRKCKHCGEFVNRSISKGVLALFAVGLVIACALAGMRTTPSEGVLAIGVWAIFTLVFARMFRTV